MRDDAGGEDAVDDEPSGGWGDDQSNGTSDPTEVGDSSGNVAGTFGPSETIEPGKPKLTNALFVLLGAYLALLGLVRLVMDLDTIGTQDLALLAVGTLLVTVVILGFFGLLTPDT